MRVTLCYPSLLPGQKPNYGLQPLGILHIAALLKRNGFDVVVIDADVDGMTVEEMTSRILPTSPEQVGLSLMTPQPIPPLQVSVGFKQARPNLPILLRA